MLPDSTVGEIRASMRREHLKDLEASLPIRWLPLAVHMDLLEAAYGALGDTRYQQFWRDRTMTSLQNPLLFGKAFKMALKTFGKSSLGILRGVPVSMRYAIRGSGELRVELEGMDQARFIHDGFPPKHSEGLTWASSWLGALEGVMSAADQKVRVTLDKHEPAHGYFEYLVEAAG
ncbi:MAG: hypothetical protein KC776_34290 [Myxococcales bacterium]|nr:hypothetical protein [Myxococcales bacterium]MCB9583560.1 hypothetical protein [Polyangiaceae bacterium]